MRLLNRPLAFILAAALAAASIIVMIEVTAFHFNSGPLLLHWTTWYHWAGKTHWDQLVVQVWSAILIVAGALILALELKPPPASPACRCVPATTPPTRPSPVAALPGRSGRRPPGLTGCPARPSRSAAGAPA